jgi:GNAT superfamily N-acetyltransferase
MGKIVIRQAKPFDTVKVARLLIQAYDEPGNLYPEPNELMVLNWVTEMMNEGFVVVAEKEGRVLGSVGVSNYRFPWSEKWYLSIDWMYVLKGFRDGGVFEALLKRLHAFADERKAPIYAGISSGNDPRLKDRMMQMKGYTYLGGQFIRMESGHGQQEAEVEVDVHPA